MGCALVAPLFFWLIPFGITERKNEFCLSIAVRSLYRIYFYNVLEKNVLM